MRAISKRIFHLARTYTMYSIPAATQALAAALLIKRKQSKWSSNGLIIQAAKSVDNKSHQVF